jgi:hypothetical protein
MSDEFINDETDRQAVVAELHEALTATAERPVERTASRWIGEAEAIAADLIEAPDDPAVIRDRAAHIVSLLENVDQTGDRTATEHVEDAKVLAARLAPE